MTNHQTACRARGPGPVTGFLRDEGGAVTIDWVVLTAAIVGMGIAAGFTVSANVPVLADKISETVESQTVVPD